MVPLSQATTSSPTWAYRSTPTWRRATSMPLRLPWREARNMRPAAPSMPLGSLYRYDTTRACGCVVRTGQKLPLGGSGANGTGWSCGTASGALPPVSSSNSSVASAASSSSNSNSSSSSVPSRSASLRRKSSSSTRASDSGGSSKSASASTSISSPDSSASKSSFSSSNSSDTSWSPAGPLSRPGKRLAGSAQCVSAHFVTNRRPPRRAKNRSPTGPVFVPLR